MYVANPSVSHRLYMQKMVTSNISQPFHWFFNKSRNSSKLSPASPAIPPLPSNNTQLPNKFCTHKNPLFGANTFTTKEQELLTIFRHFDTDGDGKISSEEFGMYFASIGESISNEIFQRVVSEFDSDGDKLLEFNDFVRLLEGGEDHVEEDLKGAFEMFEVDKGDGVITPRGLQKFLCRLGDAKSFEECVDMIRAFDTDGNGVLDFQEFKRMMNC